MITLDDVSEEFVVGGVFLRLFISQPNWVSNCCSLLIVDILLLVCQAFSEHCEFWEYFSRKKS